jgi:hypothetical protein
MMGNLSEFYSDNMGEDIAMGKRTSAGNGVWTNGTIPFGFIKEYRLDRGRMRPFLVPDPKTAPIIVRMVKMYLDGPGSQEIAKTFREENVPGPTDQPWKPQRVRKMLKNIAYAGYLRVGERSKYDEAVLLVRVPTMEIITLEDHERVQEKMTSHTPTRTHPRSVASRHLLSSLVHCDRCDCKMSPTGGERSYYNCNDRRNKLSPSCDTPNPRAEDLDYAVLQHVLKKVTTQENMERLSDIVANSQSDTMLEVEEELRNVNLEIADQKESRRNLLRLVEKGTAVEGDVSERLQEIRGDLTRLEGRGLIARAKVQNEKAFVANAKSVKGGGKVDHVGESTA